jgi:uncharacterized membrane protein
MESVMIAAGAVLGVGSLSGLGAAVRVAALERRLEALERSKTIASTTTVSPTVETGRVEVAPTIVEPERDTLQDRWNAFEYRAGTRWTSWLGAVAFVIAAALLIKLAVERGWLAPTARFALGIACAVGFLAAGWRAHRARMRVLSHGLLGAGLGVLYISLYVASVTHALLPSELAFGAMVAVTIAGCVLALALDAQALATIAWLGGLATPLLVPSVIGSRDPACMYVLMLALVGSICAGVRQWQALALAVFAGSSLVFGAWLVERHDAATWRFALAWLAAFHLVHHVPTVILAWRRSIPPLWLGLAFANAATALGGMAMIVDGRNSVLGGGVLALAILHVAMARFVRRCTDDRLAHVIFPALAIVMTTTAIPLLVPAGIVTFAWSVEAVALIALLREPHDTRLRRLALAVLGFAAMHATATAHGSGVWLAQLSIAIVPVAAWSFATIHRRRHPTERGIALVAALGGLAFLLLAVSDEIYRHVPTSTARAGIPAVWAAASLVLSTFWYRTRAGQHAAAVTSVIAAYLAYVAYRDGAGDAMVVFNVRCGAAVSVLAAFALIALQSRRWAATAQIATLAGVIALVGGEIHVHYAGSASHAALSIGWAALAGVLLAIGFVRQHRTLRTTGLGLLGLVAAKLVLVDLAGAPPLLRVISFVVIGTVMISASYGYHRLR